MIDLGDLLCALRQQWRLVAFTGLAVFVAIAGIALVKPREYLATSSLLIDVTKADPTEKESAPSPQAVDTILGTQADVVRSSLVLREVAQRAGLATGASQQEVSAAAGLLNNKLVVGTDRGSNVIRISYLDRDRVRAARVVNTVAEVFLRKQVELRTLPARTNARWYNDRVAEVRRKFEQAQSHLSEFQRQHGIVGMNRMDLEADKVRNLSTALSEAQAHLADARSRAGSSLVPEVASSAIVQDLQREIATQSAKVADLAKTLGVNHPQMIAERAQLAQLNASLGAARSGQAQSLSAASGAAGRREADLRRTLVEQQTRMIALSSVQDDLSVLERDVEAAKQNYDAVRERLNDAALRSEIPQASASLLDQATPPVLPAKPNLLLWLVAAVVLGAIASVLPVVVSEIVQPRVRSASGTAKGTEVDVIMDLTQPTAVHVSHKLEPEMMAA